LLPDIIELYAIALRDSSFRGARLGAASEVDFAESDFGINFLGFLRSPFVDAGGLFSLFSVVTTGFDCVDAVGLFADSSFEASFGGDLFGSESFFEAGPLGLEVCAFGCAFGCASCFDCIDSVGAFVSVVF
jgi:hypothetical protein